MSKLFFQAVVKLNSATQTATTGDWQITTSFTDKEGVYLGSNIQAGDIIIIDTGMVELGTLTRYEVLSITTPSVDATGAVGLLVRYQSTNDNSITNPDLSHSLGFDAVVTRAFTNTDVLPVPSPGVQLLPDRFSFTSTTTT